MALFKMRYDLGGPQQVLEITLDSNWIMFEIIKPGGEVTSASVRRDHFDAFVAAYNTQRVTS